MANDQQSLSRKLLGMSLYLLDPPLKSYGVHTSPNQPQNAAFRPSSPPMLGRRSEFKVPQNWGI